MSADKSKNAVAKEDQRLIRLIGKDVLHYPEVVRLAGSITDTFTNLLGREKENPGIHLNRQDDKLTADIHIVVAYGVNIPQISYDIQNSVKEIIENNTECTVGAINIGIEGVEKK